MQRKNGVKASQCCYIVLEKLPCFVNVLSPGCARQRTGAFVWVGGRNSRFTKCWIVLGLSAAVPMVNGNRIPLGKMRKVRAKQKPALYFSPAIARTLTLTRLHPSHFLTWQNRLLSFGV